MKSLLFTVLALLSLSSVADELDGKVVAVASGDSITVRDDQGVSHHVRLAAVDAPEEGQPYFHRSQHALSTKVSSKRVRVLYQSPPIDNNIIGLVRLGSEDINIRQIHLGLAWYYRKHVRFISDLDSALFAQQEKRARTRMIGLWRDAHPIPPWQFRSKKQ